MNVAEADVAIAVIIFLNKACRAAASAFLLAGSVWKESAVIGTKAVGTPIHSNMFGKMILSIEDVVFICVSINNETAIVTSPIEARTLLSINLEISPTASSPIRQMIALGNIVNPDIEGL